MRSIAIQKRAFGLLDILLDTKSSRVVTRQFIILLKKGQNGI
jgi:hypothetical protein